jgi:hypothetical protein
VTFEEENPNKKDCSFLRKNTKTTPKQKHVIHNTCCKSEGGGKKNEPTQPIPCNP